MVDPGTAATAVAIGSQVFGGLSARKKSRKAGRRAAKYILAENAEKIRRDKISNEQSYGRAYAGRAASGFQITGSIQDRLEFMKDQQEKEIDWSIKSAKMRARQAKKDGASVGESALLSSIGSSAQLFASAYEPSGRNSTPDSSNTGGNARWFE